MFFFVLFEIEKPAETTGETTTEAGKAETTEKPAEEAAATEAKPTTAAEGEEEEDEEEEGDDEEEGEEEGEDLTKNDEQAKDEAEAEDISNLQRSWEMFELAKLIYSKNFDTDMAFKNKRIAECLLKLGEISIEQESYEQACIDIGESIRLQEELKENRDERMLAESFYQLGLSQQFNNQFTEANESYQKSINIMQMRVETLKAKLATMGTDADAELEKTTMKDEIAELESLLPEMIAKLEEVQQGQQSLTLIKEAKECFLNTVANGEERGTTSANGEVKDITSLVKSKRKISSSDLTENGKKTKVENGEEAGENESEMATSEKVENKENMSGMNGKDDKPVMEEVNKQQPVAEQIVEAATEITA